MQKKIYIHFGGCGGSYSYLLGLATYLQQNYDLSDVIFFNNLKLLYNCLILFIL